MSASSVVYAVDLARMGAFYEQGLGLVMLERGDSHLVLESEAWLLTLVQAPPRIAQTIEITDPPRRRSDAAVKLVFAVTSITAVRGAVIAHGAGQVDSADTEWVFRGALRCDGIDPEGNVFQLRQLGPAGR